jgi:hypothetical protein
MLRRISEPMRDEIIGGCRKLYNGELHNLYSFPTTAQMIKSGRKRLSISSSCSTHGRDVHTKFLQDSLKKRDYLEDLGIDLKILKWIEKKNRVEGWSGLSGLGLGPVAGSCEQEMNIRVP